MAKVSEQIYNHLTTNMDIKKRDIMIGNFLGGIAWGVGTVVGAVLVVALVGYILNLLGVFDFVSSFIKQFGYIKQL